MNKRKVFYIGTFTTALEAATAYNEFITAHRIPAEANNLQLLASQPEMTTPGWFKDPLKVPPSPRRKRAVSTDSPKQRRRVAHAGWLASGRGQ